MNIVLYEPEIPQNTGNIARTCAATGAMLHLVGPMGFSISDKHVKRAGLDYWDQVDLHYYDHWSEFEHKHKNQVLYYVSTKASQSYDKYEYPEDAFFIFGPESRGLPEQLLIDNPTKSLRIPMKNSIRSLNLSNSVAIIIYEVLRQQQFRGLEQIGFIPKRSE